MIPKACITEWRNKINWPEDAQIEQDLILSKIIVELYSDEVLKNELAFRGGTALQKLFFKEQLRYSEDIDLVQINSGPIGYIINKIRAKLDYWLGEPTWKQNQGRFTLNYKFDSEYNQKLKVKIEVNTREHFNVLGCNYKHFSVNNSWYKGQCTVVTYKLEELLGTKLRALYQRRKGRDFFDIALGLDKLIFNENDVIRTFNQYMKFLGFNISRAEFEENLFLKLIDNRYLNDIKTLIPINSNYLSKLNVYKNLVHNKIIKKLKGEPWKGEFKKCLQY